MTTSEDKSLTSYLVHIFVHPYDTWTSDEKTTLLLALEIQPVSSFKALLDTVDLAIDDSIHSQRQFKLYMKLLQFIDELPITEDHSSKIQSVIADCVNDMSFADRVQFMTKVNLYGYPVLSLRLRQMSASFYAFSLQQIGFY